MTIFYQEPDHIIHCGHALDVLRQLTDESIDMAITSPPYWGLRTYKTEPIIWGENHCEHEWGELLPRAGYRANDSHPGAMQSVATQNRNTKDSCFCTKCGSWRGELGLEPTIELYISHLVLIFNEVKRVLKKTGTCWVNLDDSYTSTAQGTMNAPSTKIHSGQASIERANYRPFTGLSPKSLCLIPQRFAIAMVNAGWILRNDIAWNKPNPMPESVKDRFTGSWEHLFFFAKSKTYFFEQQFQPVADSTIGRPPIAFGGSKGRSYFPTPDDPNYRQGSQQWGRVTSPDDYSLTGCNKRDVWQIATEPYPEAHFATFPEKLVETPILAGSPAQICAKCGKARKMVYQGTSQDAFNIRVRDVQKGRLKHTDRVASDSEVLNYQEGTTHVGNGIKEVGYTDCGCNAGFSPGAVLDPFTGSGTAQAVAKRLGRKSIGIELNPDYCKLAAKRLQAVPLPMRLAV